MFGRFCKQHGQCQSSLVSRRFDIRCFVFRYKVQFLDGNTSEVSHWFMKKCEPRPPSDSSDDEDHDNNDTVGVTNDTKIIEVQGSTPSEPKSGTIPSNRHGTMPSS